ncbi:MAG TPA: 2-phosphosulfolactate phosphatase [Burkholderiaceae bacterium]|nr:2-phosphosulfolactate phosphatase [Burkholderiaceae bacterium]
MQKVHVIFRKDDLDPALAPGKIAVVLDVIFATSTIVTALREGARSVVPARDEAQARELSQGFPPGEFVLAGEYHADTLPGFHPYNPLAMRSSVLSGKDLIYATTNGTVALHGAMACKQVYAGSLLNASALADHLLAHYTTETLLLVCSGSRGTFSLEDFYGAGCIVSRLLERSDPGRFALSDSAIAALRLCRENDALDILMASKVGRRMAARDMEDDIRYAATLDACPIVPALMDGKLVRV